MPFVGIGATSAIADVVFLHAEIDFIHYLQVEVVNAQVFAITTHFVAEVEVFGDDISVEVFAESSVADVFILSVGPKEQIFAGLQGDGREFPLGLVVGVVGEGKIFEVDGCRTCVVEFNKVGKFPEVGINGGGGVFGQDFVDAQLCIGLPGKTGQHQKEQ